VPSNAFAGIICTRVRFKYGRALTACGTDAHKKSCSVENIVFVFQFHTIKGNLSAKETDMNRIAIKMGEFASTVAFVRGDADIQVMPPGKAIDITPSDSNN
jgi:hypothetical protein